MSIYEMTVAQLPEELRAKIIVVSDHNALCARVASEFADLLAEKQGRQELLTVICPVGPLNYKFFADEVIKRGLTCRNLRTVNMDEYLDDNDQPIPRTHPLSFRKFMDETFFAHLPGDKRPLPENIIFPDPDHPEQTTELIDSIDGADICWAGIGITGHVAFNDPPEMLGEPTGVENYKNCKTRKLTISDMSTAQMGIGGTNGNLEILPRRAITVGMYEMLKSKRFHYTFMRSWHAGLWRRALLGSMTSCFPGSLLQDHPHLTITMTELAAQPTLLNTAQATGEEG